MNILLLEDDFELVREISKFLTNNHFHCDSVYDGSLVGPQLSLKTYDLILLDVNVPGMNGLEVCNMIRSKNDKIPILMLTAYGEIEDKVNAFHKGADDYLVKPFHFEELLVRINALLRRRDTKQVQNKIIRIDDLSINVKDAFVQRGTKDIPLTPKEFKLLVILAEAKGRVLSKQMIAGKLWDDHVEANPNTIEVYINFLRGKIDKDHTRKLIHTKVGFGYYLKSES
jgi:DNA-binding response OmpR family regulator